MIYRVTSTKTKSEIESQLAERAKSFGFGVLGSYDFKEILESKGDFPSNGRSRSTNSAIPPAPSRP